LWIALLDNNKDLLAQLAVAILVPLIVEIRSGASAPAASMTCFAAHRGDFALLLFAHRSEAALALAGTVVLRHSD
jgi:hypothetical protein